MEDTRKGFLTPEEMEKLHKLLKLKGLLGVVDGPVLKILDDVVLEKVKAKIPNPETVLPTVYLIIDTLFEALDVDALIAELEKKKAVVPS
jgi:hypothetical protein